MWFAFVCFVCCWLFFVVYNIATVFVIFDFTECAKTLLVCFPCVFVFLRILYVEGLLIYREKRKKNKRRKRETPTKPIRVLCVRVVLFGFCSFCSRTQVD